MSQTEPLSFHLPALIPCLLCLIFSTVIPCFLHTSLCWRTVLRAWQILWDRLPVSCWIQRFKIQEPGSCKVKRRWGYRRRAEFLLDFSFPLHSPSISKWKQAACAALRSDHLLLLSSFRKLFMMSSFLSKSPSSSFVPYVLHLWVCVCVFFLVDKITWSGSDSALPPAGVRRVPPVVCFMSQWVVSFHPPGGFWTCNRRRCEVSGVCTAQFS